MASQRWPGLTAAEAARRLAADGPNALPTSERRTALRLALDVVREPMFVLLLAAGGLYVAFGDVQEALTLLGFVVIVMAITIVQEGRTERALDALRDLSSPRAQVLRDGAVITLAARELVAGDVIRVAEGDRVPADAALREGTALAVDESLLTGESVPVAKLPDVAVAALVAPGGDGTPALFAGTVVVAGRGVAEVLATGPRSQLGRIGAALREVAARRTPLQTEIATLVRWFAIGGGALSIALAVIRMALGTDWREALLSGITLAMALLPEELPVVMTVFLALGAWRIARHGVLTRRVTAVETLGGADVLCTDKTGTLTQNRMTIARLVTADVDLAIAPDGDARATLTVGNDDWPFAFPLVKADGRWRFDTAAGKEEMLARRVGKNELDVINVMLAIVDAQRKLVAALAQRHLHRHALAIGVLREQIRVVQHGVVRFVPQQQRLRPIDTRQRSAQGLRGQAVRGRGVIGQRLLPRREQKGRQHGGGGAVAAVILGHGLVARRQRDLGLAHFPRHRAQRLAQAGGGGS